MYNILTALTLFLKDFPLLRIVIKVLYGKVYPRWVRSHTRIQQCVHMWTYIVNARSRLRTVCHQQYVVLTSKHLLYILYYMIIINCYFFRKGLRAISIIALHCPFDGCLLSLRKWYKHLPGKVLLIFANTLCMRSSRGVLPVYAWYWYNPIYVYQYVV